MNGPTAPLVNGRPLLFGILPGTQPGTHDVVCSIPPRDALNLVLIVLEQLRENIIREPRSTIALVGGNHAPAFKAIDDKKNGGAA